MLRFLGNCDKTHSPALTTLAESHFFSLPRNPAQPVE
jgi:hypothetical protein